SSFVVSFFYLSPRHPTSTPFPYTTLFRSPLPLLRGTGPTAGPASAGRVPPRRRRGPHLTCRPSAGAGATMPVTFPSPTPSSTTRSEEHTSELQSRENLVCRLLLEKKKNRQ